MTELHGKIYLTKADMPKGCNQCPFCNGADECMVQNEDSNFLADTWDDLRRGCPLEEIEPVTVQEWISVKDRLPEPGVRVLASDEEFVGEFYINKRGQWQRYNVNDVALLMALDVLWWKPLPRPPKGE